MLYILFISIYIFIGCIVLGLIDEPRMDKIDFIGCLLAWPLLLVVALGMYINEKLN